MATPSVKRAREDDFIQQPTLKFAKTENKAVYYPYKDVDWKTVDPSRFTALSFVGYNGFPGGYVQIVYENDEGQLVIPVFRSPKMRVPFDVKDVDGKPEKHVDLCLQFSGWKKDQELEGEEGLFMKFMEKMDKMLLEKLDKHKTEWYPGKKKDTDKKTFAEAKKVDILKQGADKETGEPYAPHIQIRLPKSPGSTAVRIPLKTPVVGKDKPQPISHLQIRKGSQAIVDFIPRSFACTAKGCSLMFQATKAGIELGEKSTGEADDVDEGLFNGLVATAQYSNNAPQYEEEDQSSQNEEHDQ